MQGLLVLRQAVARPGRSSKNNRPVLALCYMGPRLSGTLQDGPWRLQAHPGGGVLTVYFGTPNMFITLWFGFVYGTNLPLGTLII
jgi:hypothetical protein